MNSLMYGHTAAVFLKLTIKELKETIRVISEIEERSYLNKGDFQLWENSKKDEFRLYKDFEEIGLKGFVLPIIDNTNKVNIMRYCNNSLSYGISIEDDKIIYYLCESPILSNEIIQIISTHSDMEDLIMAFFDQRKMLQ